MLWRWHVHLTSPLSHTQCQATCSTTPILYNLIYLSLMSMLILFTLHCSLSNGASILHCDVSGESVTKLCTT